MQHNRNIQQGDFITVQPWRLLQPLVERKNNRCKIIVAANQKGGVAKTITVRNLSYALAELGHRVLTVDFDPQANLSISFGIAPANVLCSARHLMRRISKSHRAIHKFWF